MDIDDLIFMSDEKYQQRYCDYMENSTPYNAEIISMSKMLIDGKDYCHLSELLKNYDKLVKKDNEYLATLADLPYWACCFCSAE